MFEAIVMSYIGCVCTCSGMYGMRRPIDILWYQLDVSWGFSFQVHGGDNHPFVNCVTKKAW